MLRVFVYQMLCDNMYLSVWLSIGSAYYIKSYDNKCVKHVLGRRKGTNL